MNDDENIKLYLQLFKGREDYFAEQLQDRYSPVRKPFDEFYLRQHVGGDATYGLYVLDSKSLCHLLCVDIDIPKDAIEGVNIKDRVAKYSYLKTKLQAVVDTLLSKLGVPPESILLEETGGRGYHIWIFLAGPLDGMVAVNFGEILIEHLGFHLEVFPKQGNLNEKRKLGNLIKLPLGVHKKYGSRSVFFSLSNAGPLLIDGLTENFEHLRSLVPVTPDIIAKATEAFGARRPLLDYAHPSPVRGEAGRPQFEGLTSTLVAQCHALNNIRAKAEEKEALTRSEAFHFTNCMLSVPGGVDCVHETMMLSFGQKYDRRRTQEEIEKIAPLHPTSCLTLVKCSICPDYCKESVRKRNEDPLALNTTPCGVWLQPSHRKRMAVREDLLDRIAMPDNVKRAFFQLKRYHEHEDLLFFDPFDFDHFETHLDANCEVMAKALKERTALPFAGYLPVLLPKKFDDNFHLEFRKMSYSSVYDQAPVQAAFNIVAPLIEDEFLDNSYGYRWNLGAEDPSRIFEDWREAYPRFRNAIMDALRRNPNGYHVCCDIKGYYDNVDHNILMEQIRRLVSDKDIYGLIEHAVRAYEFQEKGGKGLPQGPAYARILANLYLNDIDRFITRITPDYFRYVDDLVLVFKNREDAEQGLEQLAGQLLKLGLELSSDEAKKPIIEINTDVTRVRKTLDKIQYGILEGTRHLPHLAPQAVMDFGDAVERQRLPENLDQLVEINDLLPSLLYVVTQKSLFPHPLKVKVRNIVGYLIRHGLFCPKKLKSIFYYILKLEPDRGTLRELFKVMESAHKTYFILSVFACWKTRGEFRELLEDVVAMALTERDPFVWGFAVAIAADLNIKMDFAGQHKHLQEVLSTGGGIFGLLKWVGTVGYDLLGPDEQKQIRGLVGPNSPDLIKIFVLTRLTSLPSKYIDELYIRNILKGAGVLLLPAVSALLASAVDATECFYGLIEFGLGRLAFKSMFISFVTKEMFDKRASSSLAEMDNLKALCGQIGDQELARAMLNAQSRIANYGLSYDKDFAKQHKQVDHYHECYLFESTALDSSYSYLELIPENRLREYIHSDLDSAREIIADFSANSILLPSNLAYSSEKGEVCLEFRNEGQYVELDAKAFSREPSSKRRALMLAAQAYKKALYFRRKTGKVPPISVDNVLVDSNRGTLVFRTFGKCLCVPHFFGGIAIGDEVSDVAEMVSIFLRDLLFESESEAAKFLEKKQHKSLDAFLCQCIRNMGGKEAGHRYSYDRFAYLIEQFTEPADLSEQQMSIIYLRERLKAALFKFNSERISWAGICRSVNEHITEHLRVVCGPQVLHDAPYQNRLLLAGRGKHGLHTLSRELLNLVLNRKDLLDADYGEDPYFDLLEFLLLYSIVCIEGVSLARVLDDKRVLRKFVAQNLRIEETIRIEASGLHADFAPMDLSALLVDEPKEKSDQARMGLSLRQLAVQELLACGLVEVKDHLLKVEKPRNMSEEIFYQFAHATLIRIPQIEKIAEGLVDSVSSALRSNEDFARPGGLAETREAVEILAEDLQRFRKCLNIVRHHGYASCRYFPPDISCKSWFRRTTKGKEVALPEFALTNTFPTSGDGYASSWDMQGGSMINLVIPSEGVNSLIVDLSKGKVFGYKVRYLYSGKAMLLCDVAAFIPSAIVLAVCGLASSSTTLGGMAKGFSVVGDVLFGGLTCSIAGKVVLFDLQHWVGSHKRFIRAVQGMFTR